MRFLLGALVIAAGMLMPAQAGINAEFRRFAGHPLWAGLLNFAVGLTVIALAALLWRLPLPPPGLVAQAPWWAWIGGLCGATLVLSSLIAAPQLGAALLITCLVAGQLLASLVIDHYGWVGYPQRALTLERIVGAALLVVAVWLIQRSP
jgi:transporter family-2 protein